jgi:hypothetical protein
MKLWLEGDEKGEVEDAASRAREEAMEKKGNGYIVLAPIRPLPSSLLATRLGVAKNDTNSDGWYLL